MNGVWEFNNGEEMSITTYGFKGCIFGEDTLKHSQNWKISNDTIYLLNDEEIASLTCKILSQDDSNIKLQLYSDIYVNLTKE